MTSRSAAKRKRDVASKWRKRAAVKRGTQFDRKLVCITEKVLKQVFGEDATASICDYLEKNYRLKLDDIPNKPEVFSKALESYLDSGATVIERIILENLYSNSGVTLKRAKERTFPQRLSELKRVYGS